MNTTHATAISIKAIEVFVFRAPIDTPVKTSFGVMRDRPATFVRLEDADGFVGWGEIWCNFPNCGAEHRARLTRDVFAPLVLTTPIDAPEKLYRRLSTATAVLAIQSGEFGPIAQVISGIDIVAHDLFARRANLPLWKYLGGQTSVIRTYASGINPDRPEQTVERCQAMGFDAFKLKVGFDPDLDLRNVKAIRKLVGDQPLMIDANQAWDVETAKQQLPRYDECALGWIEEPMRADETLDSWSELASTTRTVLAAGENMTSRRAFDEAIESGAFGVLQPDIAKWGGLTDCLPIARSIKEKGLRYCPHYLGGGIGLLASAHLLAAVGGDGMLEIDSNPNPLRTLTCGVVSRLEGGLVRLTDEPGLGDQLDLESLRQYQVM